MFLYFFIPFLLYACYGFLWSTELVVRNLEWGDYGAERGGFLNDRESIELPLSLGFLLFTILNWVRCRAGAPFSLGRQGCLRLGGRIQRQTFNSRR